jgi:hypothetical protein
MEDLGPMEKQFGRHVKALYYRTLVDCWTRFTKLILLPFEGGYSHKHPMRIDRTLAGYGEFKITDALAVRMTDLPLNGIDHLPKITVMNRQCMLYSPPKSVFPIHPIVYHN